MSSTEFQHRDRFLEEVLSALRRTGYYQLDLETVAAHAGVSTAWVAQAFPEGKTQAVCESMKAWAPGHLSRLHAILSEAPDTASALESMFDYGCKAMRASGHINVCPIAIIALENALSSHQMRETCVTGLDLLSDLFRDRLRQDGVPTDRLADLSILISTVFEGCFVSSRVYNDTNVMAVVGRQLADLLRSYINELSPQHGLG